MSKPRDPAVGVIEYFKTAPLDTARTVHGLAGRELKARAGAAAEEGSTAVPKKRSRRRRMSTVPAGPADTTL